MPNSRFHTYSRHNHNLSQPIQPLFTLGSAFLLGAKSTNLALRVLNSLFSSTISAFSSITRFSFLSIRLPPKGAALVELISEEAGMPIVTGTSLLFSDAVSGESLSSEVAILPAILERILFAILGFCAAVVLLPPLPSTRPSVRQFSVQYGCFT